MSLIEKQDPELFAAMRLETDRQRNNLELIASENYCSRAVMEAVGVHDILTKAIGTCNPHNVLRATMCGLASLRSAESVSEILGKTVSTPRK